MDMSMTAFAMAATASRSSARPQNPTTSNENWYDDLPGTFNPVTGKEDTAAIIAQCERAYKTHPYLDPNTVLYMRRALFKAICTLREKTYAGYLLDQQVPKGNPRPAVLQ
jgi:hypothetical protein